MKNLAFYKLGTVIAVFLIVIYGCGGNEENNENNTSETETNSSVTSEKVTIEEKIALGETIFFDTNLSEPLGQGCVSCHNPDAGFANPNHDFATSEGAVPGLFADRNAPSIAYSQYSPDFYFDGTDYIGGQFMDGRAATLEKQAGGPPLNPVEMHNATIREYIDKIAASSYSSEFKRIYGQTIFNDENASFAAVADALATYERSSKVSRFSSKFDAFQNNKVTLTAQEKLGLDLFTGKANCHVCHPIGNEDLTTVPALFTEYDYVNIGVPKNPENPYYNIPSAYNPDGTNFVDFGLSRNPKVIADGKIEESKGKFKTPTLRNVELTAPYMHNGVFKTLKEVVEFYNTRDTNTSRWGPSEVSENIDEKTLVGDLKLTNDEVDALVAFLKTLTDGYTVK
ncbi:cytochrome c peroxidase [Sulfuricurvum sp.]|uniref:cytochrome-c peroxidase n=1 Tax=Sulfuricurvum sp. TaxID=2025608 RepID=UPI002634856E|nr:cytochrome c peroxidase [Sulfuricurvum sp.]MDD3597961.1 cytochrome c peroxidase [Sulfuricurvum sp.]